MPRMDYDSARLIDPAPYFIRGFVWGVGMVLVLDVVLVLIAVIVRVMYP